MGMTKVSINNTVFAMIAMLVVALGSVCMGGSASAEPVANDGTIIDGPELAATLFYPKRATRSPGILVLGGAEGGRKWAESTSLLLASHGYVAMAESYFNAPGLPAQLQLIPLERFRAGVDRLASDPRVDPRRIAIVGLSKGAEAALVLGPVAADDAEADAGFGGGTPAGVIDARSRSWALVLAFLDRSLRFR